MSQDFVSIPVCQLRESFLVLYEQSETSFHRRDKSLKMGTGLGDGYSGKGVDDKIRDQRYKGKLGLGAIKRLKLAIDGLVAISEWKKVKHPTKDRYFRFKLNFITLTLPAPQKGVSDKTLTREALKPFIRSLKDKYPDISYVWKAEVQENGNLHYHIVTDRFVRFDFIKDSWNQKLKKFHFIKDFAAKHHHSNPNSTDIHSTKNIRDFSAYLIKYMCKKEEGKRPVEGKLWDCSMNLKSFKRPAVLIDRELSESLNHYIATREGVLKEGDRFSLVFVNRKEWSAKFPKSLSEAWNQWTANLKASCPVPQNLKEPSAVKNTPRPPSADAPPFAGGGRNAFNEIQFKNFTAPERVYPKQFKPAAQSG